MHYRIISCALLLAMFASEAKAQMKVKQELVVDNPDVSFSDVSISKKSKRMLFHYSKRSPGKSPNAHSRIEIQEKGFSTIDNGKIVLDADEYLVLAGDGFFISQKGGPDLPTKQLNRYAISGAGKTLAKSIEVPGESSVQKLDGEGIIVSDQSEGHGSTFYLYSNDLRLITAFTPMVNGFNLALFRNKDNYIVYGIIESEESATIKLVLQDWTTGRVLAERTISDPGFRLVDCSIDSKDIVVLNTRSDKGSKVTLFNLRLEQMVSKELAEPVQYQQSVIADRASGLFFVATNTKLYCFRLSDGAQVWVKNLADLTGSASKSRPANAFTETLSFQPVTNGKLIGICLGDYDESLNRSRRADFLLMNKDNGEIVTKTPVDNLRSSSAIIKNIDQKSYLIIDGKIYKYELQ
jgi:hypothetical protein